MSKLIRKGSKGDSVKELQTQLQKLGFEIEADGVFGKGTEAAVLDLQKAFGYTIDGIVGEGTARLIEAQINYGWNIQKEGALETAQKAADAGAKK